MAQSYFDRKIDAINPRTAGRELASGLSAGLWCGIFGVFSISLPVLD